jgi:hypothetical protein
MGKLFLMPSYIFLERPLYLLLLSRSRRREQTTDAIRARFWQFTDWDAVACCAFLSDVVSYPWETGGSCSNARWARLWQRQTTPGT